MSNTKYNQKITHETLDDELASLYNREICEALEKIELVPEKKRRRPPIIIEIEDDSINIIINTTINLTGWKFWATIILGLASIIASIVLRIT